MKKILSSIFIIAVTLFVSVNLTSSYFSDTETASANSFTAGSIDLLINGENNTSELINFSDLKPGDNYFSDPKILSVSTNDAWTFLHIKDLTSSQGTQTEPEETEEAQNGARHDIQNYITYDLSIDDEPFVSVDDKNTLPDMTSCWIPLGQIQGNGSISLIQSFHFSDSVTNWAQGDTLDFAEEFYAEQVRNNPNPSPPSTGSARVWNPDLKRCEYDENLLYDSVTVDSTNTGTTPSNKPLENGKEYVVVVAGTYIFWPSCSLLPTEPGYPGPCIADAEYALRPATSYGPGWVKGEDDYPSVVGLDLQIDGNNIEWGSFTNTHEYYTNVVGDGTALNFSIYDSYYPDNSGDLTVDIYQLP